MTTLFSAHRLMEKLVTNSHFSVITSWSFSFFFWLQSFHSRSQWRTHLPPQPIRTRQSWGSSWRRNCRETERLSLRSRSPCWRKVTACFIHLWCCSVALPLLALAMIDGWSEWSDGCHKFPLFLFLIGHPDWQCWERWLSTWTQVQRSVHNILKELQIDWLS